MVLSHCSATQLSIVLPKKNVFSINLKPGKQRYERKAQWESDSKENTVKTKKKELNSEIYYSLSQNSGKKEFL